jgi:1,4-dihydroxy-2-naphthoyl-CoA hydrolase
MPIWNKPIDPARAATFGAGSMLEALGIRFLEFGDDFLRAAMPVDARTRQPLGLLHGGASVVLAETLGSFGGWLCLPPGEGQVVGIEINANHLRAVREGEVVGTARPIHLGRSTQVWETRIVDPQDRLVCISRLTLAVVPETPRA